MSYLSELLGDAYTEGMSVEEIDTALQAAGVGITTNDGEAKYNRLKESFDKTASEVSKYKKLLAEKETEAETALREEAEKRSALETEFTELKTAKTRSEHLAQLAKLGYPDELAAETAEAMISGDTAAVFAAQQKLLEIQAGKLKADLLGNTTPPNKVGSGGDTYQSRLEKAREAGNTPLAVQIKREAAENGEILF